MQVAAKPLSVALLRFRRGIARLQRLQENETLIDDPTVFSCFSFLLGHYPVT